jgi:hypothetical protein
MITNKTQLEKDINNIDQMSQTAILAASAFAHSLNNAYIALWSLPEDRLLPILQKMYDDNTFLKIFGDHNYAASAINTILNNGNHQGVRAYDAAPKEIEITDGILSFKVIPVPEIVDENVDNIII